MDGDVCTDALVPGFDSPIADGVYQAVKDDLEVLKFSSDDRVRYVQARTSIAAVGPHVIGISRRPQEESVLSFMHHGV